MSYVYSNGLCKEALLKLSSEDDIIKRMIGAFGEMRISKKGDTSPEIWERWEQLHKSYIAESADLYKKYREEIDISATRESLNSLSGSLVYLIYEWIEYNSSQISKGFLKEPE